MKEETVQQPPSAYHAILEDTARSGFSMASDILTGTLLRSLAAAKPAGKFLELGTGTGLSTSWILDGMDEDSSLVSIDNDESFLTIAQKYLGSDRRLQLVNSDGEEWITQNSHRKFDYIFADTWHGKYLLLEQTISMLKSGAFYIIDDMLPQPNWPEGHAEKANKLVDQLDACNDLFVTKQSWSTGIIIAVKKQV